MRAPPESFDVGIFKHAGVDPTQIKYVQLKSRQHFRAGFEPLARHIVMVSGPGGCSSDYEMFPFRPIQRPMYPLDTDAASAGGQELLGVTS